MDLLTLNQFAVLLWKNFTLKRRKLINSILEIFLALVFSVVLLVFHTLTEIKILGPHNFTSQPISTLPSYIRNASEWELIYIPSDIDVVKEITENVKRNLNISIKVRGFSSEREFEKYIQYDYASQKVLAAIVFDCDFENSNDPLPLQVKYHLRFIRVQRTVWWPDKIGWQTTLLFPNHPSSGPRNPELSDGGSPGYIKEGFLAVQHALDKAIMLYHESSLGKRLFDGITIFVQRFPYPAFPHHGLLWVASPFLPLMFILTFSPIVLSIMQYIVQEKENRLKEYQLIIGLRNWIIWAAYFFTFFLLYIIIISLICVLFFTKISDEPVLRHSDCSFIFVFFVCYAIASIFFGFMVSTLFNKAHLVASAGNLMFFASFFPFNFIFQHYGKIPISNKVAACLSSNVALALGINLLIKLEIKEIGVKWHNLWTPASLDDNLIFGYLLGMLLLDAFLYGLVTWYVETVFPGQCGVPQPWYFFLLRSYWFGKPRIKEEKENAEEHGGTQRSTYFEAEPINLVAGIQIKHLHKEFNGKAAVNDLSLNVYEGQVTILLGHNGAGKSTTLSVLTGRFPPTRGEAHVNGLDISDNMIEIRKNLGFCPQHDLLFKDLTLSEHLFFYSVIKGMPLKMHPLEIDHMLSIFDLLENRHAFSHSLSEGAKRKLSVIIALIGGSKVVILDEPSSGMDPVSKRLTWNLLLQYKHNRTILVTTPYMDEADTLGDRIAILVRGTLQCCGSSVFLKQTYGAGYHIVMQREPLCDVEKISAMIQSHVPGAELENDIGDELSFVLLKEYTHRFEALFDELEKNQKELGIANFGVSISTMKEVFLKPINGLQIVQCLAFGISILAGSFCLQTVTERISKAKHIQFLSGVYVLTYWLSALLWDLICFSVPCFLLLVSGVFKFCDVEAFVVNYNFLDTMLIFMLYGWCIVPLMYLGSFLFSNVKIITYFLYFLLILSNLKIIFIIYFLLFGIILFFVLVFKVRLSFLSSSVTQNNIYSFGEHGIAKFLVTLAAMGLIFLLLLFSLETAFWSLKNFVFHNIIFNFFNLLTKVKTVMPQYIVVCFFFFFSQIYYKCPVVRAVRNISLVVQQSECFGLLGLNGAGKTTIFKMLTGEETITSGVVLIDGSSVTENIRKIRSRIGYCPQSDSVLNHMTGRELLIMYARLWGVPESDIYKYVEVFLCSVHLEPLADNFIYTYSGGSKRRLSTAIALMGKSSVVLLDEPSTGMDPVARHLLWDTVTWICKTGKAIIITSHSMEDCEALCTRLAIMVKGMFICLGSPRHVRNKFGNIHTLTAKINISKDEDKVKKFKQFIEKAFPGNVINQDYQGIIGYFIPSKEICWGKVFSILEKAKVLFNLEDYSISQITLEQIFLTFANIDKLENSQ
uniref:ABC transporter domain-containing protein n=1 Tax=Sciurus vulgaris TaxID=55149 RepID=A0A8D2E3W9_SCIVU